MKIGIIGATGLIGRTLLSIIEEQSFQDSVVFLSASKSSVGKRIYQSSSTSYTIQDAYYCLRKYDYDLIVLAVQPETSKSFIPYLGKAKWIIDISSAHRNNHEIPLIVPEINGDILNNYQGFISNPNCATIQLVKTLYPISKINTINKIVLSTYQSISGMGQTGLEKYNIEWKQSCLNPKLFNCVTPWIGKIEKDNCEEEQKIIFESKRILRNTSFKIYPTTVRVPVDIGHGESVYVETKEPVTKETIIDAFKKESYIHFSNDEIRSSDIKNKNKISVGRLRICSQYSFQFWSSADNLRVGSAWNAFQIIQTLSGISDV